MDNYSIIPLGDFISVCGEDFVSNELSAFSCPKNQDIECYLKNKAILFQKSNLSPTYLVYATIEEKPMLVGYFTITLKSLYIHKDSVTRSMENRIRKFGKYDPDSKKYDIPCILIAQLGKNYGIEDGNLIKGRDLLNFALEKVQEAQRIAGGKIVFLECEDNPKLISFYRANGFEIFDKRDVDPDEQGINSKYLIRMLRYLK